MGYTTKFHGRFNLSRKLSHDERKELMEFLCDRHDDKDGIAPSMWCDWRLTPDDQGIEWDKKEKFYEYMSWLEIIISEFLDAWGIRIQGNVAYWGEREFNDFGTIIVRDNCISLRRGFIDLATTTLELPRSTND